MIQIAIMRMRAKKSDHDKVEQAFKDYMDYEHEHPELFHYSSTRFYFMDAPGHPGEETWMFIDHFDDYQKYLDSLGKAVGSDPTTQEHFRRCMALMVPHSVSERELWTEAEQLRVDF